QHRGPRLGLRPRLAAHGAEASGRRRGPGIAASDFLPFFWCDSRPDSALSFSDKGAVMVLDEKDVFVAALALPEGEEREAYLRAACAGRAAFLGRVRELLAAHEDSQGPLDRGPAALGVTVEAARAEGPGSVIGPYRLLEPIGEGGMGTVWM